jgi:hypothetical protein
MYRMRWRAYLLENTVVRSRSRFNLLTNLIAAAKTVKVLRNEKTKDGKGKEKKTAGDRAA